MTSARHRWGEPARFPHKTERTCLNGCGITKVGHHQVEAGRARHWTDFWRDGERIVCAATPPCDPFVASCVQIPVTTSEIS
jgi:hypothetical protein